MVHCCRLRGVELAIALFDATGPLVPGNGGTDMVWSSPLTGSGDFRLGLAGCQRKDLVAEVRRTAFAAGGFCSRRGRARRYPLSPRIQILKGILAKIRLEPAREPLIWPAILPRRD